MPNARNVWAHSASKDEHSAPAAIPTSHVIRNRALSNPDYVEYSLLRTRADVGRFTNAPKVTCPDSLEQAKR
jgi:hypothetical protein